VKIVKNVGNEKKLNSKLENKINRTKCSNPPNSRTNTVPPRLSPGFEGRRDSLPLNVISNGFKLNDIANIFASLC
jgi:hypothetical protein